MYGYDMGKYYLGRVLFTPIEFKTNERSVCTRIIISWYHPKKKEWLQSIFMKKNMDRVFRNGKGKKRQIKAREVESIKAILEYSDPAPDTQEIIGHLERGIFHGNY